MNTTEKSGVLLEENVEASDDGPLPVEPMDPKITSIQPGGGIVMQLELAWGHVRRWWLRTFRRSYVDRMAHTRRGSDHRCPHEVLDSRDVKYYSNRGGYCWDPADDPFTWRDRLPFARAGLAELVVLSLMFFGGAVLLAVVLCTVETGPVAGRAGYLAVATLLILGGLVVWFFRDPRRRVPTEAGTVVSPADGKVVTIERIPHDDFVGGPAVLVGIFLSIFNAHINRSPFRARVIGLTYEPGKFLNALRSESVRENERLEVRLQATEQPRYRFRVRQISGAFARRIVCWLRPGDELEVGERFGMIKLGSRTELVLPDVSELQLHVQLGEHVNAGASVIGTLQGAETAGTHGT